MVGPAASHMKRYAVNTARGDIMMILPTPGRDIRAERLPGSLLFLFRGVLRRCWAHFSPPAMSAYRLPLRFIYGVYARWRMFRFFARKSCDMQNASYVLRASWHCFIFRRAKHAAVIFSPFSLAVDYRAVFGLRRLPRYEEEDF